MPGTTPAVVITEPVHFLEEASCESTIFGFRPRNFRETRKSLFATKSRRDAIFGNSHHESATRFSGNPKVFSEGSLKRNADFRVRPPLGLYNTKRHRIRENGLPRSVEAPEGASRPCRLSIVPGPVGLMVVGTISVPPRARLCPNFEPCRFPSNFRPGAVCICVCVCICMCVCMCVCVYTCMFACVYDVCVCMRVYICLCICQCVDV